MNKVITVVLTILILGAGYQAFTSKVDRPNLVISKSNSNGLNSFPEAGQHNLRQSVVLYTTSWCGFCKRARSYLNKNGIQFTEVDIEKSREGKLQYEQNGGRGKGVPYLVSGSDVLVGFNKSRYADFFNL